MSSSTFPCFVVGKIELVLDLPTLAVQVAPLVPDQLLTKEGPPFEMTSKLDENTTEAMLYFVRYEGQ